MLRYFLAQIAMLLFSATFSQKISGVVTNQNGVALNEAIVLSLPDSSFALTSKKGHFTIASTDRIHVRKLGYAPQTISLNEGDNYVRVQLKPTSTELDEITINDFSIVDNLLQIPGNREYIARKQLQMASPEIITPELNKLPGVYMQSGALNTNRITIRGIGARSPFSTNKIRAYYGEIPLTNGTGETTIEDIDISHLGSMEIIKGPNSSIYGSGLGGVMLLNPVSPDAVHSSRNFQIGLGSYGLFKTSAGISLTSQNKGLYLGAGRQSSNGYRENNELQRTNAIITADLFNQKNQLTILGYLIDQQAEIPSSIGATAFEENPRQAAANWAAAEGYEDYTTFHLGLGWDRILNDTWIVRSAFFGSVNDNYEPRPFNILDERTYAYGVRSRAIADFSSRNTLMFGLEFFNDLRDWQTFDNLYRDFPGEGSVQGDLLSLFNENRAYINVFAKWKYDLTDKLLFTSGINVNKTFYEIDDNNSDALDQSGDYSFDPVLSPRVALSYQLAKLVVLYASVSHGFSTPTLEETLTPEGLINENIKPETGWMQEIGSRGKEGRLSYSVSAYLMQVSNLLVARRTAQDQYIGLNAGSTRHNGIETSIQYNLIDNDETQLILKSNYSFQHFRFKDFMEDNQDFSGNRLTGVPQNQSFSEARLNWKGFYLNTSLLYIDEVPITDDNSVYNDDYSLVNSQAGYTLQYKNFTFDLSLWANNILDTDYASMVQVNAVGFGGSEPRYYYPGLPRNYFTRFRLEYFIR